MNETKRSASADAVLTALFCVFILVVGALIFILPQSEFSEIENSSLQTFPSLTYDSFMHGDFTKKLAEFYTDQIPCRDQLIALKGMTELLMLKGENNGVILGKNGHLISRLEYNKSEHDALALNAEAIKQFEANAERAGIDVTVAIAPRAIDVLREYLPVAFSEQEADRIWQTLNDSGLEYIDFRDILRSMGGGAWFKTDHHWTSKGAYAANLLLSSALSYPQTAVKYERVSEDFFGTTYSDSGFRFARGELFEIPRIKGDEDFKTEQIDSNGKVVRSFDGYYDRAFLEKKDKYSTYIGGNFPLVRVSKQGEGRETLLIIKDSFAHSLVPYLAQHFDLLLVDLRYYSGSALEQARENGIKKALVLYGIDTVATANLSIIGIN